MDRTNLKSHEFVTVSLGARHSRIRAKPVTKRGGNERAQHGTVLQLCMQILGNMRWITTGGSVIGGVSTRDKCLLEPDRETKSKTVNERGI